MVDTQLKKFKKGNFNPHIRDSQASISPTSETIGPIGFSDTIRSTSVNLAYCISPGAKSGDTNLKAPRWSLLYLICKYVLL